MQSTNSEVFCTNENFSLNLKKKKKKRDKNNMGIEEECITKKNYIGSSNKRKESDINENQRINDGRKKKKKVKSDIEEGALSEDEAKLKSNTMKKKTRKMYKQRENPVNGKVCHELSQSKSLMNIEGSEFENPQIHNKTTLKDHIQTEEVIKKRKKEKYTVKNCKREGLTIKNTEGEHNTDTGSSPFKKKKKKLQDINDISHLRNEISVESKYIPKLPKKKNTIDSAVVEGIELSKSQKYLNKKDILDHTNGRHYTISIAVPASLLEETCISQELQTYVVGQLARSACIYSVDEIVVYNDKGWSKLSANLKESVEQNMEMMKMILEYQECPQYLRRDLFPMHNYMRKAGVLNPLNASHHFLASQWSTYREGVVLPEVSGRFSLVNVGLQSPVEVDRKLEPGLRVTVKFPPEVQDCRRRRYGYVVSPEEPRTAAGHYWGYTVRVANSLVEVFKSDRLKNGYDLIIGTSDKGQPWQDASFKTFSHALIVFGGVDGIEAAMAADDDSHETDPTALFPHYLNVCPSQSSRTIRTEEAVLITLATLSHKLLLKGAAKPR